MQGVTALHREAMEHADLAAEAKRRGDASAFAGHTRAALEKEAEACRLVAGLHDLEPTRSVLHRSAASLALDCGEIRQAEQLIGTALAGEPPEEIAEELRDLLEDVYFRRHLALRGVSLQASEFQMSLEGPAVGCGIARSDYFVGRVKDLETLIYRTAERRLGREFREAGRRKQKLADELELYVSVPRAASFAVTFKLGKSNQMNLPGIDFPREVIDDLLDCFEMVDRGEIELLRDRIPDESYFRNFVGLAQKIAPDGKGVRTLGFTNSSGDGGREVALSRPRSVIREAVTPPTSETLEETESPLVEIRGVLLEADAKGQREGQIEIVDKEGTPHKVRVPRGMMSDVVKPWFEEEVIVLGRRRGEMVVLESIDGADGEMPPE